MEVNPNISPSLHPDNIRSIDGFDQETQPYVQPAIEAMATLYQGLADIHTAREAARQNPVLNEAAQVIATADYADKVTHRAAKKVDAATATLTRAIQYTDEMLSAPLGAAAGTSPLHMEIRAHVKGLSNDERLRWFNTALKTEDKTSLIAVLGAPPFLSGNSPEMHSVYLRMYHEKTNPAAAKRLKVMRSALEMLMNHAPAGLFIESEKAIGANRVKVNQLRKAKTQAEAAFVMREIQSGSV